MVVVNSARSDHRRHRGDTVDAVAVGVVPQTTPTYTAVSSERTIAKYLFRVMVVV